jgi:ubiquinone/menaquinone biosynthesis C-methylase UbiE
MKKNEIISKILPEAIYDKGFKIGKDNYPFFSFTKPGSEVNWSDELAIHLEESSKTHFIDRYNRKVVLDQIRDKLAVNGCSYLDMGCSSGYMLEDVLENYPNADVTGADYISAGLMQCHGRLPDIPLFQVDLTNCQFNDDLFDAVTCLNVLEHIKDDVAAMKQLFRIIKPDGKCVITVPMDPGLYDIYDEVHQHERRYKMGELKKKVKAAGFDILAANHFGVFVYPAFYLVKQLNKMRYNRVAESQKEKIVFSQIKNSSRLKLMENICDIEYFLGKSIRYPFGIRGYITAQKPKL